MRPFAVRSLAVVASLVSLAACAPPPPGVTPASGLPASSASGVGPQVPRNVPPGPIHHVVLITIDGMRPEAYVEPDAHGLRIPNLRRMMARGAASDGALPVFPSVTYPAHTTMSTGVSPLAHGIRSNYTFDPFETDLTGWQWYAEDIQRDPVWRLAERAGYPSALVYWPVSVGAKVTWLVPEYWRAKDDNDRKLLRVVSTPGLLDDVAAQHPDFWSRFAPPRVSDSAITDIATHVLATGKPALMQIHLVEVDGAQHHFGIWSPEAIAAIETDDAQLGRIFDQLQASGMGGDTDVIVASDHGFMNVSKMIKPGVLLREAGLVTLGPLDKVADWKATIVANGGEAYVYLRDPADVATATAVRTLFSSKAHAPESGIGRVYETDEIKSLGGDPTAFLALEATPGWELGAGYAGPSVVPPVNRGHHGYDPRRPEMRASLLMVGSGVPCGRIAGARLVDIAPTIASFLGLAMPGVEGKPLTINPNPTQSGCGALR